MNSCARQVAIAFALTGDWCAQASPVGLAVLDNPRVVPKRTALAGECSVLTPGIFEQRR